ncbi:MAG TPA: DUF72 domain-containing protein [Ktedonobacteraceae bacterium]|nr:DUF72 domain-containing protein [Ktedonobacteraceae bacterium]
MFYIGCPMWGYKEWVGNFFPAHTPPGDFLRLYSRKLNAVEGNTVFYALPSTETLARWCQETPSTFRICPKVSRSISHGADLENYRNETLLFANCMRKLGERLGPIFLQLPPSFAPTHLPQLEAFLNYWPTDMRLAVEVRHSDFYTERHALELNELLVAHKAARVMMDTRPIRIGSKKEQQVLQARERKPNLPLQIAVTTDFTFLRYIGHPRMEVNEPLLDSWAQHIAEWLKQGITVYAFCHCPYEVYSPTICQELYRRVGSLAPVPSLPVQPEQREQGEQPEQATLF